jgi:hypothetical protein
MKENDLLKYFIDSGTKNIENDTDTDAETFEKTQLIRNIVKQREPVDEVRQNKEEILILLAVFNSGLLKIYKDFFTSYGVRVCTVSSEEEFLGFARIFPINGVVADSQSVVNYGDEANKLFSELESTYPFLRTKYNPETNAFDCFYRDNSVRNIEDFIERKCMRFHSRPLRSSQRHAISLNVEISPEKEFLRVERTVTIDISSTGLFVLATSPIWDDAKKCFISVKEFRTESLIECNIRRRIKWGEKPFAVPGLGLEIVTIHEVLQDDFQMLVEKWRLG